MNIRIVTDQQLDDAFFVRKAVFIDEQQVAVEEEIDEYEDCSVHFVLYNDQNEPIGAGRFRELDGYGKVERICVLPTYRQSGAGHKIMKAIEEYASQHGFQKLKLNAQTHAIPFYEKLGYHIISEEFLDAGIPHRTMVKNTYMTTI